MRRLIIPFFIVIVGITLTFCSDNETDDIMMPEQFPKTLWGKIDYIQIGDDYDRVKEILGQIGNVDGRDKTPWQYYWIIPHNEGNVLIEFSEGVVKSIEIDWTRGNKNELAFKLTNEYISELVLGSNEDDVISVLGTPDEKHRKVTTDRTANEYVYYRGDYTLILEILIEGRWDVSVWPPNQIIKTKLDKIKLVKQ